ncbi:MAG: FAD:protein FMN transferase [Pseudomonadales bacterium]
MSRACHRLAAVLLIALCFASASVRAEWFEVTEPIMGTRIHAELWHQDPATAHRLLDAVLDEMRRIENAYSPYIEDSDLSRLNREAGSGWVETTPEMIDLLTKSAEVSRLTGGAFDITYASVGRYYDYREGKRPDDAEIAEGLKAIDYHYVEVDAANNRVRFTHPHVYIDLGGIAKGYAVDRCIELLMAQGITQASVAAGGDSRILGDRNGEPWTVGVRDPRHKGAVAVLLPLVDTAVSTSGDYERFFEEGGVRYHHILDPSTGDSARKSWSVTILGPEATFTDALSTSVFVLGPEKGLALIDSLPGIDAIIIDARGQLRYSADLAEAVGTAGP